MRMAVTIMSVLLSAAGLARADGAPSVQDALFSIYAHAYAPTNAELLALTLPVAQATAILAATRDPAADHERRAAISLLAAIDLEANRKELEALDAPIPEIGDALRTSDARNLESRIAIVTIVLDGLRGPAAATCETTSANTIVRRLEDDSVLVVIHLAVHRAARDIARALDPQAWQQKSCSGYFETSFVAQKDDPGNDYPTDCERQPDRRLPAPLLGSKWNGELYEHAVASLRIASFKNLLTVVPSKVPKTLGYDYTLFRSLCSTVWGTTESGGILIDEGGVRIEEGSLGWSVVEATKRLKFSARRHVSQRTMNDSAEILLRLMGFETRKAVCCVPSD